jgi:hypothetical protein
MPECRHIRPDTLARHAGAEQYRRCLRSSPHHGGGRQAAEFQKAAGCNALAAHHIVHHGNSFHISQLKNLMPRVWIPVWNGGYGHSSPTGKRAATRQAGCGAAGGCDGLPHARPARPAVPDAPPADICRAINGPREYALATRANPVFHHQEQAHLEKFSDIRIVGIDEKRPPKVRKEPYIDLFFMLSRQAPKKWCEDFNKLTKELVPPVKIDESKGIFIDAYVRDMNHISGHLEKIKKKITACNEQYIEFIRQKELAESARNTSLYAEAGEQGKLNSIVAALKFDD